MFKLVIKAQFFHGCFGATYSAAEANQAFLNDTNKLYDLVGRNQKEGFSC